MNIRYRILLFSFWFFVFGFSARADDTLTFVATDVPVSIADGPSGIAESVLTIPVSRVILDVNITVTVSHTFDGDLRLYLDGPIDGVEDVVRLADRCGGSGNNYTNTLFNDEASVFICNGNPPFTGSYYPDDVLSELDGRTSFGLWTFRVTDNAAEDVGSIQAWQLVIVLGDTITPAQDFIPHPSSFILSAFPNPFNSATTITFALPHDQPVKLIAYDILGREARVIANRLYAAGKHRVMFDGAELAAGMYFVHLQTAQASQVMKTVLMK